MTELNTEQKALQKAFREFAQKEIKPIAMERDKIDDPAEAFPVDLFQKSFELDLHTSCIPEKYGGMGLDALSHVVIWEELAAADAGFCVSYEGHVTALAFWMNSAPEEHLENFIRPFAESKEGGLVAVAMTEPNHGPGWPILFPNEIALDSTAVLDGNEWVLNGNKNFCTNGGTPLTKWYYVYARTDMENVGMDAHAGFAIPEGTPGFKFGPPEHKMGQRLSYNASFFMDDVRIPKENFVSKYSEVIGFKPRQTALDPFGTIGGLFVGLARAAFEEALSYAKQRIIVGKPQIQYQLIAAKLADMFINIEAARGLVWKAAHFSDTHDLHDIKLGFAAKVFASDTCVNTANEALQIHGGYGYSKDSLIEKLYRDAKVTQIYEGPNEILRLGIGQFLELGM
jgi:acyl-CoA dehydrogenase